MVVRSFRYAEGFSIKGKQADTACFFNKLTIFLVTGFYIIETCAFTIFCFATTGVSRLAHGNVFFPAVNDTGSNILFHMHIF